MNVSVVSKAYINSLSTTSFLFTKGAFGTVRLVIQNSTGLVRAMKTIAKSSLIKEDENRIFAELEILKELDHPHIIRLYELFQDEKHYYLITE